MANRLPADGVFQALRNDAQILATAMTREQALELGVARPSERDVAKWAGEPDYVGPNFGAAWDKSPEQAEQASAIERYAEAMRRRVWGE